MNARQTVRPVLLSCLLPALASAQAVFLPSDPPPGPHHSGDASALRQRWAGTDDALLFDALQAVRRGGTADLVLNLFDDLPLAFTFDSHGGKGGVLFFGGCLAAPARGGAQGFAGIFIDDAGPNFRVVLRGEDGRWRDFRASGAAASTGEWYHLARELPVPSEAGAPPWEGRVEEVERCFAAPGDLGL